MLTTTQKKLADKIGRLLAESALDDNFKKLIIENIGNLPERVILKLAESLQAEKGEIERIKFETDLFLKEQGENWQKTAEWQKEAADIIVKKWLLKLG